MTKLIFDANTLRPLWKHAREATAHRESCGEHTGPALLLVKDEGIYLMSNGLPILATQKPAPNGTGMMDCSQVAYAQGFDPYAEDRMDVWDRAHDAVGGDDFSEPIGADIWDAILGNPTIKHVVIDVADDRLEISAYV